MIGIDSSLTGFAGTMTLSLGVSIDFIWMPPEIWDT